MDLFSTDQIKIGLLLEFDFTLFTNASKPLIDGKSEKNLKTSKRNQMCINVWKMSSRAS